MLAGVLWLGFLLGLRHALEPDHLAAVTSLSTRARGRGQLFGVAAAWGLGHSLTLIVAGTALAAAGIVWHPAGRWAIAGELLAGVILVWLGVDVIRRASSPGGHAHAAPPRLASRALVVGGLHGLEGSGAVVLVALPALRSTLQVFTYLALFGIGSILGMLLSSLALSLPLRHLARRFSRGARALQFGIGITSLLLGLAMSVAALT